MWEEVGTCSAALVDLSIAQGPAGLSNGAESRKNLHNTDHGASEESLNMHWCPMGACWGHSSLKDTWWATVVGYLFIFNKIPVHIHTTF